MKSLFGYIKSRSIFSTSKHQKANNKKQQPTKSSSSGKNSDTSDKETTTSEEPSRKESMTGPAKAALEAFVAHRSKSTDSSMVASAAAAKAKLSLSPRVQHTPPNWLQTPSNVVVVTPPITKIESANTLTIREDKTDTISSGEDRHDVTLTTDGRAITESDDELADHSVNLVVLGEVGGKEYETLGNASQLVAKKLLEANTKDSKKLQFILNQKSLPGGVLKSMSDISCNRRPRSASVEEKEERSGDGEERPQSRQSSTKKLVHHLLTPDELDDNQATVGSGRGKWAKELVAETYGAMGKSPPPEIQEPKEDRRPYASEVFSRGDVIVMKRSESNEYHSLAALAPPSIASQASISADGGARDDEQAASTSRRSRFPYKFKHHTVNLLTGW
uniref:Uncharacterized protein n=2 Tax=Panagrolaimus superbus TaxID=310955 RepID=A0A914YNZ2_9BILA